MEQNKNTPGLNTFATAPVASPVALAPQAAEDEDTIDLLDLLFMLRAHLLQILAAFVLGGVLFGAYSFFLIAPTYKATTQMYMVSSANSSLLSIADLQLGSQLSSDYSALIKNRAVLENVILSLNLDMTYTELASMVEISNPSDTHLLYITVTSTNPEQSCSIANEIATTSRDYLQTVMDTTPPNIAEAAIVPTVKSGPSNSKNAMIGALLFGVACMGVYVVLYLLDDTVSTSDDLERYFNLRPLSTIPEVEWMDDDAASAKPKKSAKKIKH